MAKKIKAGRLKRLVESLKGLAEDGVPMVARADIRPWKDNPRLNAEAIPKVVESMLFFGWTNALLLRAEDNFLEAGHTRLAAIEHIVAHLPDSVDATVFDRLPFTPLRHTDHEARAYAIADNRLGEFSRWDAALLPDVLSDFGPSELTLIGWDTDALDAFLAEEGVQREQDEGDRDAAHTTLASRFGAPPFSVLDARQGYWRARKGAWLGLGIKSELGRDDTLLTNGNQAQGGGWIGSGTSIFDPVLTELMVRWFSPAGGSVLDPFAGGSVRGVVSALVGRAYTGIELRAEQVAANREQWATISASAPSGPAVPEENRLLVMDGKAVWTNAGTEGGTKQVILERLMRTVWAEHEEFVYGGPAYGFALTLAARAVGKRATIVVAQRGEAHPITKAAEAAGAQVITVAPGYLSQVRKRAKGYAEESGAFNVPFGVDCPEFIGELARYAREVADDLEPSEVWCVAGSGVLTRSLQLAFPEAEHHAIVVGKEGSDTGSATVHKAPEKFAQDAKIKPPFASASNYDAKAWRFFQEEAAPGALLWNVAGDVGGSAPSGTAHGSARWIEGDSRDLLDLVDESFDLVLSCPPYADLERYSDDERDLSTLAYPEFRPAYGAIIQAAVQALKPNRFLVWVVGEVRGPDGAYLGFVPDTIRAFEAAGARFYNEAVLVTPVGSLPRRSGKIFEASRKLGKGHQNVLIFVKGDPKLATEACGTPDFTIPDQETGDEG